MPLTQALPELRQNLEAKIREGHLPDALNTLLAELSDDSETYRIVSALLARLNVANKERYRNTISSEEYQRRIDQVSADFFDLLAGLAEGDFVAKPVSVRATSGKQGSVLYRVPNTMPIQKPTRCTIRVAVDEDAILENIVLDEHVEVKSRVEISDVMSAELLDPEGGAFQISALNARTQLVKEAGYTEWNFNVTPLIDGVHQLLVKVSIMEIVPGFAEPIPREISLMETVTIVTDLFSAPEAAAKTKAAPSADPSSAFKASGQTFGFQSTQSQQGLYEVKYSKAVVEAPVTSESKSWSSNRGLRAMALFLAFLVLAPAATWAIVPEPTRDWWVASVKDTPDAYENYIQKYEAKGSAQLEKAFFYRAETSGRLADLRAYQHKYQQTGKYEAKVSSRVAALESKSLENIRERPAQTNIRQFVADFPETERLTEVKKAVDSRAENRQELLAEVENAYVTSVKSRPTETKVLAYLRDFPKQERLNEVEAAVRARPEVFEKVQPMLEDAYLKQMEQNPTPKQAGEYLDKFPQPVRREKFEQILEKKPTVRKKVKEKMRKMEEVKQDEGNG